MRDAQEMIAHARETLKWSKYRFMKLELQKRAPASEVLQALHTQANAQLAYLGAVREYNRVQMRLLVLIGTLPSGCPAPAYNTLESPRDQH
jgi:hypothetical protein